VPSAAAVAYFEPLAAKYLALQESLANEIEEEVGHKSFRKCARGNEHRFSSDLQLRSSMRTGTAAITSMALT